MNSSGLACSPGAICRASLTISIPFIDCRLIPHRILRPNGIFFAEGVAGERFVYDRYLRRSPGVATGEIAVDVEWKLPWFRSTRA
jgi:hypothetical protein